MNSPKPNSTQIINEGNINENNPTKWQSDELYSRRGESHSPK